jgi:hypothetical protein
MRALILLSVGWFSVGCAPAVKPEFAPAPVEYYVNSHSEIYIDKGSVAWGNLSAEERAEHDEEGGVFRDVDDVILLQRRAHNALAFCVHHVGRYLHECQFAGVATLAQADTFVYREVVTNYDDRKVECAVAIKLSEKTITVDEVEETASPILPHDCHMYCGAHASLGDGIEFDIKLRHSDMDNIVSAQGENGGCSLPP